jgi:hypothetical protein
VTRRSERLIDHREGEGRLLAGDADGLEVHYVLDTWSESIATGSGTFSEIQRRDGFLWWSDPFSPQAICKLETGDGTRLRVNLSQLRSQRAHFHSLEENSAL